MFYLFVSFADVWCFDLDNRKWHLPSITGKTPVARFGQSQVIYFQLFIENCRDSPSFGFHPLRSGQHRSLLVYWL